MTNRSSKLSELALIHVGDEITFLQPNESRKTCSLLDFGVCIKRSIIKSPPITSFKLFVQTNESNVSRYAKKHTCGILNLTLHNLLSLKSSLEACCMLYAQIRAVTHPCHSYQIDSKRMFGNQAYGILPRLFYTTFPLS